MTRRTKRVLRTSVVEADRVTDGAAERDIELVRDPLCDGPRRDPSRLGVSDGPAHAATELEAQLGQLGRLARAGLPGHDDDLVIADGSEQIVATRGHWQLRRVGDRRDGRTPSLHAGLRFGKLSLEAVLAFFVAPMEPVRLAAKAVLIPQRQLAKHRLVGHPIENRLRRLADAGSLAERGWARARPTSRALDRGGADERFARGWLLAAPARERG